MSYRSNSALFQNRNTNWYYMSVNTTGMKYWKSHALILMLVPILTAACQALAAHHLGLNSHIAWEWFKIMLSNKCLEGKKSKNPLQEIIWSVTMSQHSIVTTNNLKMLTYPKEKKKGGENTQQNPSFSRQRGMNLEFCFYFWLHFDKLPPLPILTFPATGTRFFICN